MHEPIDIIVVGAGSAGCAMAGRLAEDGRYRILLLEAGDTDRVYRSRIPGLVSSVVFNPEFDWGYVADADPTIGGRSDRWPAGKRLGGGSAINGMMFIRGHAWDYDHWRTLGAEGWDYASVLPYFRRMERNERGEDAWRGGHGPVSVSEGRAHYAITDVWLDAARQAGIERSRDLNGERAEGADLVQVSQRNGLRCSAAAAYIHSTHRANLKVELKAQVRRIILKEGRATGVEIAQGGATRIIDARRGVVLCAGTLNSPRLLMLSGIGPGEVLQAAGVATIVDLPGVGRNLQDHVGTHLVNNVNAATMNRDSRGLRGLLQVLNFALRRRGILTTAIGHAQAFVKSRADLPVPNLHLTFAPFAFDMNDQGRLVLRSASSISTLVGLIRPSHRGHILIRSSDPMAAPIINHQLLSSEDDVEQLVEGFGIARRIMEQPAIGKFVSGEVRPGEFIRDAPSLRNYLRAASFSLYHQIGTCKVGKDSLSVVDADLRVHRVDALWVADASIMPSLPAGNTNATSIMIGDKGADHVLRTITASGASGAVSGRAPQPEVAGG